jgi:hypothetical protein
MLRVVVVLLVAALGLSANALGSPANTIGSTAVEGTDSFWAGSTGSIEPDVLAMGLAAARCAERAGVVKNAPTLTVIDYSRPSTEKRMWVFDLRQRTLLYEELVSHGQGSGENMATRFSNNDGSHQTSLGLFVTAEAYTGKNGYSLRMDGLEPGVNDKARERAIVIHGAPYVSEDMARTTGRLGRSWGCPAVREAVARGIIDRVKGGGLVFAYAENDEWLASSPFLGDCAAAAN